MKAVTRISAWLVTFALFGGTLTAQPLPHSVLLLDQYGGPLPWVGIRNYIFRTLLNSGRAVPISIYAVPISIYEEYLDLNRFAAPKYKDSLKIHFAEKYRDKPIGLIVAFGPLALDYAIDMRAALWPNTPVVFGEAAEDAVSRSSLPAGVTGTTISITFAELVAAARTLDPNLKHIALVGDSLENLPAYRHFKEEIPIVTRDLGFIDLSGLGMANLQTQVKALPDHTVIVYTTINLDRTTGVSYVPAEALSLVAEAANRPIVVSTETFVGRGAVGGFVLTPGVVGQDAARLASRILDGEDASTIPVTTNSVNKPVFDWRQLQRWGISESRLPTGSEIYFREPALWELYRWQILSVLAALLMQAALIGWLIYEHRRRSVAEVRSRNAMAQLAHMNRLDTAGQLSASIAHEINQPVAGIVLKASAALRWLAVEKPDMDRIRNILTDIVGAGQHAGDIISSVRAMFKKEANAKAPINLNNLVNAVLALLRVDLQKDDVRVETQLDDGLPMVMGDAVQLQQVILNLVVNAADAMLAGQPRVLKIQTSRSASGMVHLSIEDSGPGISPPDRERIFDPLFTTKAGGMGMGLSICRSITENHGGRIWVLAAASRGAIFQFELPAETRTASQALAA